jgi:hypothetical protein
MDGIGCNKDAAQEVDYFRQFTSYGDLYAVVFVGEA